MTPFNFAMMRIGMIASMARLTHKRWSAAHALQEVVFFLTCLCNGVIRQLAILFIVSELANLHFLLGVRLVRFGKALFRCNMLMYRCWRIVFLFVSIVLSIITPFQLYALPRSVVLLYWANAFVLFKIPTWTSLYRINIQSIARKMKNRFT